VEAKTGLGDPSRRGVEKTPQKEKRTGIERVRNPPPPLYGDQGNSRLVKTVAGGAKNRRSWAGFPWGGLITKKRVASYKIAWGGVVGGGKRRVTN